MNILSFCKAIALTALTSLALMHLPATASTTVDFNSNSYPVPPATSGGTIDSGGFTFAAPLVGMVNGSSPGYDFGVRNNSPMLVFFGDADDVLTVVQTNGGSFSLSSLDVGRWFGLDQATGPTASPGASLSITGYTGPSLTGAQEILAPFTLPELTPPGFLFTPVTIPQSLASFQSMTFRLTGYGPGGYVALDNLVLTPVPDPETYAMMLAGLGLLGFVARRRKQKLSA
jgi:hypothetical protein